MLPSSLALEVLLFGVERFLGQWAQRSWKGWATVCGGDGWAVEAVVAAAKHGGGDAGHNGLRLDMEVAVHLIGAPTSDETDAVRVDTATEHGHGAARACETRRDVAHGEVGERGGRSRTVRRKRAVMSAGRTNRQGARGVGRKALRGVIGVAPAARSWRMRRASAATGQRVGWPLRPCPKVSPRTPFFCEVNVRVTKVAETMSGGGLWSGSRRQ